MSEKTVKEMWESFIHSVFSPKDFLTMPEQQYQEMRRAFYAGAQGMLTLLAANAANEMSDEQRVKYTQSLSDELMTFAKDVVEGRA